MLIIILMNKFLKISLSLVLIFIIGLLCTYLWNNFSFIFNSSETIKDFVLSYGILSPFVFIFIMFSQVLLAPIPGQVLGFVSGYIFGWELGTIYSMIGLILGSYIAFYLSRRYGRAFVERIIKKETLKKLDEKILTFGGTALFLIFLLPGLPDDLICFFAGLSKIRMRMLILIAFIGRLPGYVVLNFVGDGFFSYGSIYSVLLFGFMMLFSVVLFVYREKIENSSLFIMNLLRGLFVKKRVYSLDNKN